MERKKFRYFYINGKLHKMLRLTRSRDEAVAWCFSEHKTRIYQWSEVRRRASRGFTIGEVSEMVMRTPRMIQYYMEWGLLEKPELTYSLTTGNPGMLIFSEEDVYKIRDIAAGMHKGRPRADGIISPRDIISKQELTALMKYDLVLYAKNKNGEFVPLYAAEDW
jgi:MerR HTH family regulatory protein